MTNTFDLLGIVADGTLAGFFVLLVRNRKLAAEKVDNAMIQFGAWFKAQFRTTGRHHQRYGRHSGRVTLAQLGISVEPQQSHRDLDIRWYHVRFAPVVTA